ncbi:MAG TPA: hypothetical protein VFV87_07505 [Pirellulaceae bacterium]|nr:hypothetical protein [Pirellulaceae bacterium]
MNTGSRRRFTRYSHVTDQPESSLQERIEELAAKSSEGELTDAERAEYVGYVQANKFVAILQAQARRRLAGSR